MEKYEIGDIRITYTESTFSFKKSRYLDEFLIPNSSKVCRDDVCFEVCYDDLKSHCTGELLQKNGLLELYQTEKGLFLVHHWTTCRFALGVYMDDLEQENVVTCYVDPNAKDISSMSITRFLTSAGLHSKLLQKGALVFHSSYINWNDQAVLFAGKSGIGKSTQSSLWEQHAGAEIINGDRTLLRKKEGVWYAYGYPCCGSSDICKNRILPLKAIVILEKGDKNEVQELTMGQKYRALFTGSEMYLWYEKEMERVSRLVDEIMKEVRVIKLICRPDADAVEVLKAALEDK